MSTRPPAADPTEPAILLYLERSRPSLVWWPAGVFVIASVAIAYGAMLGPVAGALIALVGLALLAGLVAIGSWRIRLTDETLSVGSASVSTARLRGAESLNVDDARHLAGPGADARSVFKLRGGIPAVRIDLDDAACPYWLVSTRTPDLLAAAITGHVGAAVHSDPDAPQ
ncbi:unannotated protein [freshwater metagenome]|uniref:Unannotated protein n=1 Tax=freshwater metagenome TaxID=449393 RepID=A0A6J7IE24_9ZZZZ